MLCLDDVKGWYEIVAVRALSVEVAERLLRIHLDARRHGGSGLEDRLQSEPDGWRQCPGWSAEFALLRQTARG